MSKYNPSCNQVIRATKLNWYELLENRTNERGFNAAAVKVQNIRYLEAASSFKATLRYFNKEELKAYLEI